MTTVNLQKKKNGTKFSKRGRKNSRWEKVKLLVTSSFSFSHSVFRRLVLQTHKKKGLFGKGLNIHFTSIEKQVLTTDIKLSGFCFLGTTPVLGPNM